MDHNSGSTNFNCGTIMAPNKILIRTEEISEVSFWKVGKGSPRRRRMSKKWSTNRAQVCHSKVHWSKRLIKNVKTFNFFALVQICETYLQFSKDILINLTQEPKRRIINRWRYSFHFYQYSQRILVKTKRSACLNQNNIYLTYGGINEFKIY